MPAKHVAAKPENHERHPVRDWLLRIGAYGSLLFGLSAVLLIWIGAAYFTHNARLQTEQDALQNAKNLSRAFEEQIIRSIRSVDQTLLYARDTYAHDPQNFNMSLWQRGNEFMNGITFQLAIIDQDGMMVASNLAGSGAAVYLGDREHFRVHAERDTDELYISKPVLGRVSNKWSVQLTRRIIMPDGSFGGVVVVSLNPDYLGQFYESIDVGEYGSITLVGTDGIVRARGTKGPSTVGASLAGTPLLSSFAQTKAGHYVVQSKLDGIERLFVYREVKGYPLIVVVGLSTNEIFSTYVHNRNIDFGLATLLTLWLLGVTYLVARYQRMLAQARDAAEAGTRARSEFLAMMSHEIRTPMNGVIGMAEVLLESGLRPDQLPCAKIMRESAEHLLKIINDVLDFSKLEADRVEIEQLEFDLPDLVRNTVMVMSTLASEKKLVLSVTIAADVPRCVIGDPARLRQLLLNLVGNGLKFTKQGGVEISVACEKEQASGHIQLKFSVADTGIGIPADGLKLLFREFSQLDNTIARRFGGTGLGLAICKRLIDLMGGTLMVESKVGKGTTFRFTIDYQAAPAHAAAGSDVPEQKLWTNSPPLASGAIPGSHAAKILIVEDDKTNQLVASKLIEGLGFSVDIASNGAEAVAACSAKKYDLIFMDVMMPEMDGLAATKLIRSLECPYCDPFIIALTANAQTHDKEVCLEAGMDDYLAKPVTRVGFAAKLSPFLGNDLADVPTQANAVQDVDGVPIFDEAIHAELAATLGPEDTRLVVETFLRETGQRIESMRKSAKGGDNASIQRDAHAIKSAAASLGFLSLSGVSKSLEAEALGLKWPDLDAQLDHVAREFAAIQDIAKNKLLSQPVTAQSTAA
jgi:signal transduction histidine kinase/CheY-like chemotaxis protein/HPt (histidine-containing phosphotransfer) domain-containing protein